MRTLGCFQQGASARREPYPAYLQEGPIKILAIDQARSGAWAIFDYEEKRLLRYETFNYDRAGYSFAQAVKHIEALVEAVVEREAVDAVFFEDIQLRQNVASFKALAQLQGVLINLCEKRQYLYDIIAPAQWQGYCNARGRTAAERKAVVTIAGKKESKALSIDFVRERFRLETDNDNLSDAICMGWYAVNNIQIVKKELV